MKGGGGFRENDLVSLVGGGWWEREGGRGRGRGRALGVVEGRDANGSVRVRLYLPDGAVTEDGMGERGARAGTKRSRSGRATTTTNANANAKKDGDSERFRAMRNALTATASKGEWCWELKNLANISTVTASGWRFTPFRRFPTRPSC